MRTCPDSAPDEAAARADFDALVQAHAADLRRYALRLCRSAHLAEDLVQETFLRAWRARHAMREPAAAKSWLMTILRREHARLYERTRPHLADTSPEGIPGWEPHDTSTEAFVVRRAVAALPEKYRQPLELQVLAGYSCEEIAAQLGLSRGAVMTRVFRAREKLRTTLEAPAEAA
jgi:RNA polymerase sigma-70 factor (ECF subfamily)